MMQIKNVLLRLKNELFKLQNVGKKGLDWWDNQLLCGEASPLCQQYVFIAGIVTAFWAISAASSYINTAVLSHQHDFEANLFVVFFQCCVAFAVVSLLAIFRHCLAICTSLKFPPIGISRWTMLKTLPLSLSYVGMILTHYLCLRRHGNSVFYLVRSLTTLIVVAFTCTILRSSVSSRVIVCCSVITMGILIDADMDVLFYGGVTLKGVVIATFSTTFVALNSILTKKLLPHVDNCVWTIVLYNNFISALLILPLLLMFHELPDISLLNQIREIGFWVTMVIGGFCACAFGAITALLIKVTSPLTFNISCTVKTCIHTIALSFWYNGRRSTEWWASYCVVLHGCAAYTMVQFSDLKKKFNRQQRKKHEIEDTGEGKLLEAPEDEYNL